MRSMEAWHPPPSVPFARQVETAPVGLFEAATERFVVIDTETTGLQRDAHIVELAAAWVDVRKGEIVETRTRRVNPGMPIPRDVSKIHGIYDRDVKGCPPIGRMLTSFFAFLGDGPVIAHNARFDVARIRFEAERTGCRLPARIPVFCSKKMAAKVFPGFESHRLQHLIEKLSIRRDGAAHSAAGDACATGLLTLRCMAEAKADIKDICPQEDTL